MSQTTVVKSFADLPHLLNLDELPPGPTETVDECPSEARNLDSPIESAAQTESTIDLADLLAERDKPFLFASGYGRGSLPAAHRERVLLAKPYRKADLRAALDAIA